MKKVIAIVVAAALCLLSVSALAAGKLDVEQENFCVISSYWTYAYAYAKVTNVGDKPIAVNAGVFEVYDAEGDVITSSDYLDPHAQYLQPGEYTYASIYSEIEDADNAAAADDYALTITGKSEGSSYTLRLPVTTDLAFGVEDGWWTYNYMYATVTNDTDDVVYSLSAVLALLDAEGNILYVTDDSLYSDRGLTPGSSIVFRADIPSGFMDYFAANGITPASVDAAAYVNVTVY